MAFDCPKCDVGFITVLFFDFCQKKFCSNAFCDYNLTDSSFVRIANREGVN